MLPLNCLSLNYQPIAAINIRLKSVLHHTRQSLYRQRGHCACGGAIGVVDDGSGNSPRRPPAHSQWRGLR